jgi:hypothetical protein
VFEEDQRSVEGLDRAVNQNEVGGEEAPDSVKVALGKGGPEVLLLGDDLDGRRRRRQGLDLGLGGSQGGDREKEEEAAHGDYVSACLRARYGWSAALGDLFPVSG